MVGFVFYLVFGGFGGEVSGTWNPQRAISTPAIHGRLGRRGLCGRKRRLLIFVSNKKPRPRGRPTFLCSRLVTMERPPKRTPKGTSALCRPVDILHPDSVDASPELQWVGNEGAPFGCFFSTKNMPDYKSKLS